MAKFAVLCLSVTLSSVSLFVTCAKMSTEMTTQTPKPMENPKMMDNSKMMDSPKIEDNTEVMDPNTEEDLMDAMKMCNESLRTEMSFLISLNESGSFPDETDKTPKCFLSCMLQALEIATLDESKIDPRRAAMYFAQERDGEDVLEIATVCAQRDKDEENHCEMAYNFLSCLFSMEIERNNKKPKT